MITVQHMSDAIFAHPRLAAIYDAFDGPRDDLALYTGTADEFGADRIVDIGCGTGNLAVLLAATGRTVVGVDPAEASLAIARSRAGGDRVTWLHGDATTLPDLAADLAVLTGNVQQVFLTDDEWARTLAGMHAALRPGGHVVFETRRPEARAWEGWAASTDVVTKDVPGIGVVDRRLEVTEVALPFVSFRFTYRFRSDDAVLSSDSTLRFWQRDEIGSSLRDAGFEVVDVREAPDRPGLEHVFVARRTRDNGVS